MEISIKPRIRTHTKIQSVRQEGVESIATNTLNIPMGRCVWEIGFIRGI